MRLFQICEVIACTVHLWCGGMVLLCLHSGPRGACHGWQHSRAGQTQDISLVGGRQQISDLEVLISAGIASSAGIAGARAAPKMDGFATLSVSITYLMNFSRETVSLKFTSFLKKIS